MHTNENSDLVQERHPTTASTTATTTTSITSVTVSAPGKILLVGGYLVLELPHIGVVAAVNARFYATAEWTWQQQQQQQCSLPSSWQSQFQQEGTTTTTTTTTTTDHPFCTTPAPAPAPTPTAPTTSGPCIAIAVDSPQFQQSWHYEYHCRTGQLLCRVEDQDNNKNCSSSSNLQAASRNLMVEQTLRVTLLYLIDNANNNNSSDACLPCRLRVTVLADNAFYSVVPYLQQKQQQASTSTTTSSTAVPDANSNNGHNKNNISNMLAALNEVPPFVPIHRQHAQHNDRNNMSQQPLRKTGLGSSACLVTSMVGAICHGYWQAVATAHATATATAAVPSVSAINNNNIIDNNINKNAICVALAHVSHCLGQGKIGSGFDVSAACYGSHIYCRFDADAGGWSDLLHRLTLLESQIQQPSQEEIGIEVAVDLIQLQLRQLVQSSWSSSSSTLPCTASTTKSTTTSETTTTTTATTTAIANGLDRVVVAPIHWTVPNITNNNSRKNNSKAYLQVLLADVAGGSESPRMAQRVLAWKRLYRQQQDQRGAAGNVRIPHWDDLARCNDRVADLLQQIHVHEQNQTNNHDDDDDDNHNNDVWMTTIRAMAVTHASTWNDSKQFGLIGSLFYQLYETLQQCRVHLRGLGQAVGNDGSAGRDNNNNNNDDDDNNNNNNEMNMIEPSTQTALADATMQLNGVVAAWVPGAGGHDAMVCLYLHVDERMDGNNNDHPQRRQQQQQQEQQFGGSSVRRAIAELWLTWSTTPMMVCPLLHVYATPYGEGLRMEPSAPLYGNHADA